MRRSIGIGLILVLGLVAFAVGWPARADAQAKYPNRPIQLICPWAAGGGTDRIARMVAVLLEKELGQPVTVVNRTGGSGAVGHTAGATAAPDGYTITILTVEMTMMHWMGLTPAHLQGVHARRAAQHRPGRRPGRRDSEWKTLKQLLDYVKANPGKAKASGTGGAEAGTWPGSGCSRRPGSRSTPCRGCPAPARPRGSRSWWRAACRS